MASRAKVVQERVFPDKPIESTTGLRYIPSRDDTTCTYKFLKSNYVEQEFFRCRTCFTGQNVGCCEPCRRICHYNHDTYSVGLSSAFCDCGLQSCRIECKASRKCTYDLCGKTPRRQKWYECITCWGKDSVFGCCEECANDCHSNHDVSFKEISPMICNCGHNFHRSRVCTEYTTQRTFQRQPFYYCFTCFTDPNEGCCYQCMKICHSGHRTQCKGSIRAFCDCGLSGCAIKCKIPEPARD